MHPTVGRIASQSEKNPMQKTYLENPGAFILRSEVKPAERQNHAEKKAISFSVRAPGARSVAVAGSFSNWDLKMMLSSCGTGKPHFSFLRVVMNIGSSWMASGCRPRSKGNF